MTTCLTSWIALRFKLTSTLLLTEVITSTKMSTAAELHSQIASIVEVLANSAVAEICKAVEDGYAVVNLEMSRSLKENECLRRRVRMLELQVSRYRAEQRLKSPPLEGAVSGRVFPGVRLLHHRTGRDTPTATGSSLQGRSRFLNRSSVSQLQKTPPTDVDQDPEQEVLTTTKTEPTESEEDSDLVIVKVEGSVSTEDHNITNTINSSTPTARTSDTQVQTGSQTEVSGSQTFNKTQDKTLPLSPSQQTQLHDNNLNVIVIEIDGEKALASNQNNYVEKTWQSFQTPQCLTASTLNELAGTSSSVASSFVTNSVAPSNQQTLNLQPNVAIGNQRFETLNSSQNGAHFSGATSSFATKCTAAANQQSSSFQPNVKVSYHAFNTSQVSSQGSISGQTFAQGPQAMKPFSCSKCPMRFSLEAELVKHVRGHRRRKYICGLCGKGFVCKSQLEIHQNVHTGEKPFQCAVCNNNFSHPSNLRRHMKLQHQITSN